MKRIGMLMGIAAIMAFAACSNTTEKTETETIVKEVEVPVETKTTTTTTTTKTNDDGTTVEVDQNGVVIGNKDGEKETTVKVTTDSTKIKIKR